MAIVVVLTLTVLSVLRFHPFVNQYKQTSENHVLLYSSLSLVPLLPQPPLCDSEDSCRMLGGEAMAFSFR